jgi:hypothetical protein
VKGIRRGHHYKKYVLVGILDFWKVVKIFVADVHINVIDLELVFLAREYVII